jgi:hypothetical protein
MTEGSNLEQQIARLDRRRKQTEQLQKQLETEKRELEEKRKALRLNAGLPSWGMITRKDLGMYLGSDPRGTLRLQVCRFNHAGGVTKTEEYLAVDSMQIYREDNTRFNGEVPRDFHAFERRYALQESADAQEYDARRKAMKYLPHMLREHAEAPIAAVLVDIGYAKEADIELTCWYLKSA